MNIVILGGGSAGWLTALHAKKIFPSHNITLVQSDKVGIIGVGEATTPHLPAFLKNDLEIDIFEVIAKSKGTFKNGINFENWNGDNKNYFHSFDDNFCQIGVENLFKDNSFDVLLKNIIKKGENLEDYLYQHKLAKQSKIDLENTSWAMHFDAKEFALTLETIGINRGINVVVDDFKSVETDKDGFIKKLFLENNTLPVDFLYDCTGFARLIIGNHFNDEWKSYSSYLPMKKAIPFWIENKEILPSYTRAIAMKYGWMWQIALPHRTGCGYVFDSDYISVEEAKREAEELVGQQIEIRKEIDFEAGRFENPLVKNCMAVGLSWNFLEPLESTSLWITIDQLKVFSYFVENIDSYDQDRVDTFNDLMRKSVDYKSYFIYLHYITKRNDSNFWKNFRKNNKIPTDLVPILQRLENNSVTPFDISDENRVGTFPVSSHLQVGYGLDLIKTKANTSILQKTTPSIEEYKLMTNNLIQQNALDHLKMIQILQEDYKE